VKTPSTQCKGLLLVVLSSLMLGACSTLPLRLGSRSGDADNPAAYDEALVMMELGHLEAAEEAMLRLTKRYRRSAGPWINLSIIYSQNERYAESETALRRALAIDSRSAVAYNHLGILLRRDGRFAEAERAYERAIKLDPEYALAYLNYGVLADLYLHQPERALRYFERYQQLHGGEDKQVGRWIIELKRRVVTKTAKASP
jgi:Flp pilus assembly protein TadD